MFISFDTRNRPKNLIARIIVTVLGVIALGVAMMFSILVFAGFLVIALVILARFWWKTRGLRRTLREEGNTRAFRVPPVRDGGTNVIEGEAVRVEPEDRDQGSDAGDQSTYP
ncbi:MAG: hypothetical protein LBI62_07455 [Candidatus Accumulibacter sp.]|jgi:membrane protein implicated in regulation of membrane protease activity|nr:hypothetical protein [Accumulibacter sp.]